MTATPAPDALRHLEILEALTECGFELAKTAAEIAKRAGDDTKLFFAASTEFRHCAFSVRMGIRLSLQLRDGHAFAARRAAPADDRERPEPAEHEPSDATMRDEQERERDREYEPVSLPQFLKTLGLVAKAAERRGDALPAHIRDTTLPKLKGLLAEAKREAEPQTKTTALAVLARPLTPPPPRSRLLNSASRPIPPLRRRDSS